VHAILQHWNNPDTPTVRSNWSAGALYLLCLLSIRMYNVTLWYLIMNVNIQERRRIAQNERINIEYFLIDTRRTLMMPIKLDNGQQ
jgi:hypothetical protein